MKNSKKVIAMGIAILAHQTAYAIVYECAYTGQLKRTEFYHDRSNLREIQKEYTKAGHKILYAMREK
jgi:hypothetical protein